MLFSHNYEKTKFICGALFTCKKEENVAYSHHKIDLLLIKAMNIPLIELDPPSRLEPKRCALWFDGLSTILR
jgi:hypothetical protein